MTRNKNSRGNTKTTQAVDESPVVEETVNETVEETTEEKVEKVTEPTKEEVKETSKTKTDKAVKEEEKVEEVVNDHPVVALAKQVFGENIPTDFKIHMGSLVDYVDNMKPGYVLPPERGAKHQENLFKFVVRVALVAKPQVAGKYLGFLKKFLTEYKDTVFGIAYRNRFLDTVQLSSGNVKLYTEVMAALLLKVSGEKPVVKEIVDNVNNEQFTANLYKFLE